MQKSVFNSACYSLWQAHVHSFPTAFNKSGPSSFSQPVNYIQWSSTEEPGIPRSTKKASCLELTMKLCRSAFMIFEGSLVTISVFSQSSLSWLSKPMKLTPYRSMNYKLNNQSPYSMALTPSAKCRSHLHNAITQDFVHMTTWRKCLTKSMQNQYEVTHRLPNPSHSSLSHEFYRRSKVWNISNQKCGHADTLIRLTGQRYGIECVWIEGMNS